MVRVKVIECKPYQALDPAIDPIEQVVGDLRVKDLFPAAWVRWLIRLLDKGSVDVLDNHRVLSLYSACATGRSVLAHVCDIQ
jgi:hypothetical protein